MLMLLNLRWKTGLACLLYRRHDLHEIRMHLARPIQSDMDGMPVFYISFQR